MPPAEIFIVRHGERVDHKDPSFSKTFPRPHDPPLTEDGKDMAVQLGRHLREVLHVDPSNVRVATSPLLRCVQTSDGIVRGLTEQNKDAGVDIFLEPSLAEGAYWLFHDMQKNPSVHREGFFECPQPIFRPSSYYKEEVSKYVNVNKPFQLNADPKHIVADNQLTEEAFLDRVAKGAQGVLSDPFFADKSVVLVAHGETTQRWFDAITGLNTDVVPPYTAWVHVVRNGDKWEPKGPLFKTPHLAAEPSES
ncbi:phosphoglycerate mutase [Angomonas deanei]|uniref:Histidine phosphatase superfamily (Branch 1), putative n=1 Tax=Angomonas deanei TaxID=59799 RepID=S9VR46_9TRYP|nr:phosphoglycerate mutase [Angomonas deanei]EPY43364.1 phosphoglycerate mutase [Angomonas deanei]CAD2215545.1 Histidine phosphatase superfamily (branch 1), putative [Angomonas deanei]|eukprot:EPY35331.1 phosphoglycerate mutase [Angomonas deanei]